MLFAASSTKRGFRLCPDLEFVPAQQGKYIWTSERIFEMLKEYGFEVMRASIDEFQIDVPDKTGLEALAARIQRQIHEKFNITASIGIAKNCLLAKLASKINKPNAITILTQNNLLEILNATPVKKLCGVGERLNEILQGLGIKTCLDLYLKTADFLERNLGKNGINFYVSLHAKESLGISPEDSNSKSISHSYTLPKISKNPEFVHAWIRLLADMVGQRLRQTNLSASTVHLWLNGPERGNFGSQRTFRQATDDGYEIFRRCLKIMPEFSPQMPKIRALGVTCSISYHGQIPAFVYGRKKEAKPDKSP